MAYQKYVKRLYQKLKENINDPAYAGMREVMNERKKQWRREPSIVRAEHPTRIDRAREYGYKAKQGFVVARAKVRKGSMQKARPKRGRRPKRMGVKKLTSGKSSQRISEERVQKKFPNLEVLGSYWVYEDGKNKWFEVVMVDPNHPVIRNDSKYCWITRPANRSRALR